MSEEEFTLLIADILEKFIKGCKFDDIVISRVYREYPIEGGRADIVIFAEFAGMGEQPFIVVEVKRRGSIVEGLDQAKWYAESLGRYRYWRPPFVAVIKVPLNFEQVKLIESITLLDTRTNEIIDRIYNKPFEDIYVSLKLIESAICTYTRKNVISVSCPELPHYRVDCMR